jgi:hypothetical protein
MDGGVYSNYKKQKESVLAWYSDRTQASPQDILYFVRGLSLPQAAGVHKASPAQQPTRA